MREATVTATTVAALRREIAGTLATTSPTAALDARLIVAHVLGWAPNDVLLRDSDRIDASAVLTADALARRRVAGEPVARVVGEKEFYGLVFGLSPETLVPRPDTETVVDAVLAAVVVDAPAAILDLGTGSGAILLALLAQLPQATGVGVDVAEGALTMARRNAEKLGVASQAVFVAGDWSRGIDRRFDVVVANPPYIASGSIADLPVEVRDHDPHVALDGGTDGLAAIRAILADLGRVLAVSGAAFIEVGFDQAAAVQRLAGEHGFACAFRRDLGGIDRVAILRRQSFPASGSARLLVNHRYSAKCAWKSIANRLGSSRRTRRERPERKFARTRLRHRAMGSQPHRNESDRPTPQTFGRFLSLNRPAPAGLPRGETLTG